jgi:hypothetical protein
MKENQFVKHLAEFMHYNYEELSKKFGWQTQKRTRVSFDKLPAENKTVMYCLAERVYNEVKRYVCEL